MVQRSLRPRHRRQLFWALELSGSALRISCARVGIHRLGRFAWWIVAPSCFAARVDLPRDFAREIVCICVYIRGKAKCCRTRRKELIARFLGFAPSVASLGALSFALHKSLAEKHQGRQTWGYAQSTGISLSQDSESAISGSGEDWLENGTSRAQLAQHNRPWEEGVGRPEWLRRTKDGIMEVISRDGTTAQIDPLRFCKWLKSSVEERGVRIIHPAAATEVLRDAGGVLSGVRIVNSANKQSQDRKYRAVSGCSRTLTITVPCTRLLITSGAWSPRVFSTLFPNAHTRIPVSSLAGHSLLVRNPCFKPQELDKEVCHAVFATDTLGFSPEWFARIGGELYLAGLNSTTIPLPNIATEVVANDKAIEQLKSCAKVMMMDSGAGKDIEVLRQGLVSLHLDCAVLGSVC